MSATAFLVHLHHQYLVRGDGEFVEDKNGAPVLFSRDGRYIVVSTQWEYHLFLNGGTFHQLLVHNFKSHEIHLIRHVGAVLYLCMKIKQAVVRIESAEQVLDAERLASDMLDVPSVVLVDGLRDKVYQFRRFTAQFLQVDVKGVVGAVHLTSVMNEILHLDIQQQRLFRILHIEGVKTTVKDFREETNMSVITESGSFYTFNVKYAEEPLLLNIEMKDFIHDGSEVNRPNNALDIYLKELGSESPKLVYLISKSVHKDNKRHIKHIGSKAFGIQYLLRGLYTHNGLLYFHTQIRNRSNVPYEVDFVTFKIVDKKVMKRTAIQEQVIFPLRAYDYVTTVAGKKDGRTVFVLDKFTIPSDKVLVVEMHEKSGGRHQTFTVESEDIVRARVINELKVK